MDSFSQQVVQDVEARERELVGLCQNLIRIPSVDRESAPPGDTTELCGFVRGVLESGEVECKDVVVREGLPNLIARVEGAGPGPHIVLNGHFDTFGIGDESKWTHGPFSGDLVDGRIYGRGAVDMKGGDAALITAFLALAERRHQWNGTLTITLFSDEETGAKFGAERMVQNCADVHGDMVLSGEPSGTRMVRFGEKGATRLTVTARGKTGHGPVPNMGRNAIDLLMGFLIDLRRLAGPVAEVPEWLDKMAQEMAPSFEAAYGPGTIRYMKETTVNVGVIRGGQKDSLIPHHAEALLDIRTPFGRTHAQIMAAIQQVLVQHPHIEVQVRHWRDPNYTDPSHPLIQTMVQAAEEVLGYRPVLSCSLGGTDLRFWRLRGTPGVVYGPTANNIGTEDEYVEVADLLMVAKVHALTIARMLQHKV